jgi:hypothetical protein
MSVGLNRNRRRTPYPNDAYPDHGATKVAAGLDGRPWIVTDDGAIYGYNGSAWDRIEDPGTAEDFELCGGFLVVLTPPDAQGIRTIKSRDVYGSGSWETYPTIGSPPGAVGLKQIDCQRKEAA